MAQVCTYTRLALAPMLEAALRTSGVDARGMLLASVHGPASSIAAGMILDVSADLQNECVGAIQMSKCSTDIRQYAMNLSTAGTPATIKLTCLSAGVQVTSESDLSAEACRILFIGA